MNARSALLFLCAFFISMQAMPETRYWNRGRGYAPFGGATSDGVIILNKTKTPLSEIITFDRPCDRLAFSFRAKSGKGGWRIAMQMGSDTLRVCLDKKDTWDMTTLRRGWQVNILWRDAVIASAVVDEGMDCGKGANGWMLSVGDSIASLRGGNRSLQPIVSFPLPQSAGSGFAPGSVAGIGFEVAPGGEVEVTDIVLESGDSGVAPATEWSDRYHLSDYLAASADPVEGYYMLYDSTFDDNLLRMGGDYLLAIVKDNGAEMHKGKTFPFPDISRDGYVLVYLGGALVNSGAWTVGMAKGYMHPTPFDGVYDLEWIDATGTPMSSGIKAQTSEDGIITLQFPYQSSVVRLRKASK